MRKEPFTWSSGWKSPIYCDNRLSLSFPKITEIHQRAAYCSHPNRIQYNRRCCWSSPLLVFRREQWWQDSLDLPFVYVRSSPKSHGLENLVEGLVQPGQKIVVVEDLISTGGSSVKAVLALRELGFDVVGLAAIF